MFKVISTVLSVPISCVTLRNVQVQYEIPFTTQVVETQGFKNRKSHPVRLYYIRVLLGDNLIKKGEFYEIKRKFEE